MDSSGRAAYSLTIAIPTYRRESVLLKTIGYLLRLHVPAAEIIVLDQTEQHEAATERTLADLEQQHLIRWIRLKLPSIPAAMNRGLLEARHPIVLFVDDDIRPEPELLDAHMQAHLAHPGQLVAGRVIQPWQEDLDLTGTGRFHFASTKPASVTEFIGCNFSLPRALGLRLGGFDENFVRVAYRFEAEFAHRVLDSGHAIHFEPAACLHHLKEGVGGTRTYGDHLKTWRPDHAVGAYYYALCTRNLHEFIVRPIRSVATRYHLSRPWRIPGSLLAEVTGMLWALRLFHRGPRRIDGSPQ